MPKDTRDRWLEFATMIVQQSLNLEHLVVKNTGTSDEQGLAFLEDLAESEIHSLKHIDLSGGKQVIVSQGNKQEFKNSEWFNKDK